MSSRVLARRGKSLASSESVQKRAPILVRQPLFPKRTTLRHVPLALRLAANNPLQQALLSLPKPQHRSFSTLQRLRDVILRRPNPVLVSLQQTAAQPVNLDELRNAEESSSTPSSLVAELPDFSVMEPYHFEPAARQAQEEYDSAMLDLESKLQSNSSNLDYEDVVPELDRIQGPIRVQSQIHALLHQLQQDPVSQIALDKASRQLRIPHKTSIMEALRVVQANLLQQEETLDKRRQHVWAVQFLLNEYEKAGMKLEEDARNELKSIRSSLAETEDKFSKSMDPLSRKRTSTRETLEDIYLILNLRGEEAKRLGFENYTDMAFQSKLRMASNVEEVRTLHQQVVSRVLPAVTFSAADLGEEDVDLVSYLTLDGVLGGVFGLSRALFGIFVHEQVDGVNGWHPDVRLFHMFDDAESNSRYLGSFYLDPYRRQIKTNQDFVGPIFQKCGNSTLPLVCLTCNIRPPVWDHMPTRVTLDDAKCIFHEFGHVLQYLLAENDVGGVFGAHNMQVDAEEMLPQFMEHWLFQESVLQSLAQLSQADEAIPKETLDRVMKQRSNQKAREIMHRIFLSELEFEMFSGLGEEPVVSVLRRVADKYRTYDPLHKSDISPLLELMEDGVRGERAARYRYLWSEIMSADAFNVFQKAGLANEEEVKRLGRLFRELFLEPGASAEARDAFRKFRGRDMSPEALFDMYGF